MYMSIYIYIYIYRERERERVNIKILYTIIIYKAGEKHEYSLYIHV